ncbi:MAG: DUF4382 domain-containing protein [Desulfobacteraceae bacterium]|jgi:hypothetical protein|nr:DUF4382 domain-containing protein [Desulfobacteraceae bacterium]
MRRFKLFASIFCLLTLVAFWGCGNSGGGSSTGGSSAGMGTLSLSLTDSSGDYQAVYVTIYEVQVHMGGDEDDNGNWQVVAEPRKTYNLCELVNGVREELGLTDLRAGHYTQMRMIIGDEADDGINIFSQHHPYANYVIDSNDDFYELKVPSGYQTGLKIVNGFEINADQTTELLLDFDASKSVVQAGNSGNWLLKPTIKVLDETQDSWIISGIVKDGSDNPIENALVSIQVYDPDEDKKDEVTIRTSTRTDSSGEYKIFVEPGDYNIVAYKSGTTAAEIFGPDCFKILEDEDDLIRDFTLSDATAGGFGTVRGNVTIEDDNTDDQYATLSFRKTTLCFDNAVDEEIEVVSINVLNGYSYNIQLPVGDYTLVASTFGEDPIETSVNITDDAAVDRPIVF